MLLRLSFHQACLLGHLGQMRSNMGLLGRDHDPVAFMANIEDFLVASDNAKMKVLFVVLDSCFGSVNAECAI